MALTRPQKTALWTGVGLLAVALLLLPRFVGGDAEAEPTADAPRGADTLTVTVAPVSMELLEDRVTTTGTLLPWEAVEVRAEVAGRVTAINFSEGSAVGQGQTLVSLDAEVLRAQIEGARARRDLAGVQAQHHQRKAADCNKHRPPSRKLALFPYTKHQDDGSTQAQVGGNRGVEKHCQEQRTTKRNLPLCEQGPHPEQQNRGGKGPGKTRMQEAQFGHNEETGCHDSTQQSLANTLPNLKRECSRNQNQDKRERLGKELWIDEGHQGTEEKLITVGCQDRLRKE